MANQELIDMIIKGITESRLRGDMYFNQHIFGIKSFHDVEVSMLLVIYKDNKVLLKIDGDDLDFDEDNDMLYHSFIFTLEKVNVECITEMLNALKTKLQSLVFDKITGKFVGHQILNHFESFLQDVEGLVFSGVECPVCMDKTGSKTKCGHYLCVPCYQKIEYAEDEDGDEFRPCPSCREPIFSVY